MFTNAIIKVVFKMIPFCCLEFETFRIKLKFENKQNPNLNAQVNQRTLAPKHFSQDLRFLLFTHQWTFF